MRVLLLFCTLCFSISLQATNIDSFVQRRVQEADSLQNQEEKYKEAILLLKTTLKIAEEQTASGESIASIYHKLGVNAFYLEKYSLGIKHISEAIKLRQQHLGKDHLETINSIYLRSFLLFLLGRKEEGIEDLKLIIKILEESQNLPTSQRDSILSYRYYSLGLQYSQLKEAPTALFYLDKVENYCLKNYGEKSSRYLEVLDRKGVAYQALGKYDLATKLYQKAIDGYDKTSPKIALPMANLGFLQSRTGNYEIAAINSEKALRIYKQNNILNDQGEIASNLVKIYAHLGQYEKAIVMYKEGHRIADKLYDTAYHPVHGELFTNRGEMELLRQQPEAALDFFQQALQAHIPDFKPSSNIENPEVKQSTILSKFELLRTFEVKGKAFLQLFQKTQQIEYLEHALANFQTLDQLIERLLSDYKVEASKFALLQKTRSIYEQAIQTTLLLYEQSKDKNHLAQAYQFNAKNKAIMLLQGIKTQSAAQYANLPAGVLEEEKALKQEVYQLEVKVTGLQQQSDSSLQAYKDTLFDARIAYDRLLERLERDYPDYYQLKYDFSSVASPEAIQQHLMVDEALVEYFIGEEQVYVFTLTSTEFEYYQLPKTEAFGECVSRFKQAISGFSEENYQTHFQTDAHQLYQWLLAMPLQKLPNKPKRLTIIPDDVLTQVSFEALLTKAGDSKSYVMQEHIVRYLYSSQFLLQEHAISSEDTELFAGFGIEYDSYTLEGLDDNSSITLYDETETVRAMGKLTYSDDEANFIADLLGGTKWLNEAATKEVFLMHAAKFKILHLAMHGVVDVEQPLNSSLIFTRTNDSTDFLLRAADIYNMEIPAEMVVLSACNTGTGQVQKGEGIRTLARAFQYAGAKNLVASLWSASDRATKEIMEYFYKNLKEGLPKDEALQKAKKSYLANASPEHASPTYWANMVTIGNVEPIPFSTGFRYWMLFLLLPIAILLGWRILKK